MEVVATDRTLETPAGKFEHCVRMKETTPLEGSAAYKVFAPNIGVIQDDELTRVDYSKW